MAAETTVNHPAGDAIALPRWWGVESNLADMMWFGRDEPHFLHWQPVREHLGVAESEATRFMWRHLSPAWLAVAREVWVGQPEPFSLDEGTSATFVYYAYHLQLWEELSGRTIAELEQVCEFGGGYGAGLVVASQAGFTGQWHFHDLPAITELQAFYLGRCGLAKRATFTSGQPVTRQAGLVLALHSLSQAPLFVRDEYLASVNGSASYLLRLEAQYEDGEIRLDNMAYFADFIAAADQSNAAFAGAGQAGQAGDLVFYRSDNVEPLS